MWPAAIEDQERDQADGGALAGEEFQHQGEEPGGQVGARLRLGQDVAVALAEQFGIGRFNLGLKFVAPLCEAKLILRVAIGLLFGAADALHFGQIDLKAFDGTGLRRNGFKLSAPVGDLAFEKLAV